MSGTNSFRYSKQKFTYGRRVSCYHNLDHNEIETERTRDKATRGATADNDRQQTIQSSPSPLATNSSPTQPRRVIRPKKEANLRVLDQRDNSSQSTSLELRLECGSSICNEKQSPRDLSPPVSRKTYGSSKVELRRNSNRACRSLNSSIEDRLIQSQSLTNKINTSTGMQYIPDSNVKVPKREALVKPKSPVLMGIREREDNSLKSNHHCKRGRESFATTNSSDKVLGSKQALSIRSPSIRNQRTTSSKFDNLSQKPDLTSLSDMTLKGKSKAADNSTLLEIQEEGSAGHEVSIAAQNILEIFAAIDYKKNSKGPPMKRPRVTQMFGRNDSTSVTISPANTPSCSQPGSPPAKSPKASLNGSLATKISPFRSNQSGDQLQHSKFSIQPLSRNQSMDMLILPKPAEPSHGAELFGFLADSRASKKTYGIGRTFKEDNQDARLLMPINTNNQTDSFSSKKLMPSLSSTKFLSASSKFQARETYSDLRKKWGVDEDDEDDLDSPRQDLQTISFQRAMGSSKKMMDELIYLLGGLTDGQAQSDLNLQRSSSVELVKKLKGQTFLYLLQSTGMFEKVYETLRSVGSGEGQDLVLDMSLLVFISLICCSDPKQMEPLIRITPKRCNDPLSVESDCLQVLSKVSQSPSTYQDPKKFKQNLTRQTKRLLSEVEEVIQSSSLGKHLPISSTPSLLALFSLARIAGFSPRPGLIPQRAIVHSGALSSIMNSLQFHCDQLECDFESLSKESKIILQNISYCMDVIETCTVCEEDSFKVISNFRESIPPRLSKLVSICRAVAIQKEIETASIGLDILIGTLRSMVNITNETSTWSERLATPSVMETIIGITQFCRDGYDYSSNIFEYENDDCNNQNTTTEKNQKVSMSVGEIFFDLLCVTLALLTNLIEQSLNGVKLLKGTRTHRSSIASHPKCTLECLCPDAITGYESMLLLYSDPPCSKPEEIELVKGSISLIINLCLLDSQTSSNGKEGTGRDEDLHPNESLIVETWQNITILNPQILNADEFFKDLKKCSIFDKGREENCNIKEGKILGQRRTASSNGGRTDDDIEDSISIEDEKVVERMKVLKEDKCLVDDEVLKLYEFLKNSWKRLKAHLI